MSAEARRSADPAALPARIAGLAPSAAGVACYWVFPVRRRVILANMRRVFGPDADPHALRHLAQCFYTHVLRSTAEYVATMFLSPERQARRVEIVGVEHLFAAEKLGRGILVLTGHFGNWELAVTAAMFQYQQYRNRFHFIRKSLAGGLERLVFGRFRRAGLRIIAPSNALDAVLRVLGDNEVAIFIMDQHVTTRSRKGVAVDFFGTPAGTNRGLALVAAHSGAPVIPATSYREHGGRHVLRFDPPLAWIADDDPERELYLNTRGYNETLERYVLEHPDQWFWMHRRWKLREARRPPAAGREET
jgi:KDO2-lipid IV(A) lauroyltransferase